ncbi:hypothetical protein ID850_03455 [Xenorhabdus sp. Flor]|uniref:hypothetical protein n=1 Tax=Xenorhabdus cabanillasii TaxID=351673 RepID=UPI0019B1460F|nr:hypothetical protein [Xenorhabdus sp. Flor]MBD2813839.1 hypothetical protein [Xenorhabdus sp. Flor]
MEKVTEKLMIEHGFTLKEINQITSASQRSGHDIRKEIMILSNSFYKLILIFIIILFSFIYAIVFFQNVNHLSITLTLFISISIALLFSSPRLRYKSFIFTRKHKG